jgi:phosphoribosylformimino-5-aminoimidazole carboxamide ribotide isomerase
MHFRPCIDLHNGKVKQIVGSTLRDGEVPVTNFVSERSSSFYAYIYKKDNLPGGHVIMLGKGNESGALEAIGAYPGGLQVGGGITPDNALRYLDAGASHVIVTSYVFSNGELHWDRLDVLKKTVGAPNLVLDLSCKKKDDDYIVVTDRWQNDTTITLSASLFDKLSSWCDEFLIHAAHVEGKQEGVDEELVSLLSECAVKPITYAGGVRSFEDLEKVAEVGKNRIDVTIGSALDLFGGRLAYREVVKWFREKNKR